MQLQILVSSILNSIAGILMRNVVIYQHKGHRNTKDGEEAYMMPHNVAVHNPYAGVVSLYRACHIYNDRFTDRALMSNFNTMTLQNNWVRCESKWQILITKRR